MRQRVPPAGVPRTPSSSANRTRLPGEEYRQSWNIAPHNTTTTTTTTTTDDKDGTGESSSATSSSLLPLHLQYQSDDVVHHAGKIRTGKLLRAEKTRLEDYHVAYRTPLHVPDHAYRTYLTGKRRAQTAPMISKVCCLQSCVGFSIVAMVFLCFIGILIDTQPILMTGTLPSRVVEGSHGKLTTKYILPADGDVLPAARTAYRAAMAYFVCILACLLALNPHWIPSQIYRAQHQYQDIPDHASSTVPDIHHESNNPAHDAMTPHWMQTIWNRCNYVIRQRLAEIGWYHPRPKPKNDRKTG